MGGCVDYIHITWSTIGDREDGTPSTTVLQFNDTAMRRRNIKFFNKILKTTE